MAHPRVSSTSENLWVLRFPRFASPPLPRLEFWRLPHHVHSLATAGRERVQAAASGAGRRCRPALHPAVGTCSRDPVFCSSSPSRSRAPGTREGPRGRAVRGRWAVHVRVGGDPRCRPGAGHPEERADCWTVSGSPGSREGVGTAWGGGRTARAKAGCGHRWAAAARTPRSRARVS